MFTPALSLDVIITAISCLCSKPNEDQTIYQNYPTPHTGFWKQTTYLNNIHESVYRLDMETDLIEQYLKTLITQKNSKNCNDFSISNNKEKIVQYQVPGIKVFDAICKNIPSRENWLLIQRRIDGSENFYRNWQDYKEGFGKIQSEFFIGLKRLHALTNFQRHELLIRMKRAQDTNLRLAHYDNFQIGNETEGYAIKKLGKFKGLAGDSLRQHLGMKFTTFDRDNDIQPGENCAVTYHGGWWFANCLTSNLNGEYFSSGKPTKPGGGICWYLITEFEDSLIDVEMLIRPVK